MVTHRRARVALGAALLALGAAGVAWPAAWTMRADAHGARIVRRVRAEEATARRHDGTACQAGPWPAILRIPALGLTAPVEPGATTRVLSVAVGATPASAAPGPGATTVLLAHDVSWFANLPRLEPGDAVSVTNRCGVTQRYRVVSGTTTRPGASLPVPASGGLVLVTCSPSGALFWTSERYAVVAKWVATTQKAPVTLPATVGSGPPVPAPAGLAAEGLTLASFSQPMGSLSVTGNPPASWSPETTWRWLASAEALWIGLARSAAQHEASWWAALAPGVPVHELTTSTPLDVTFAFGASPASTPRVVLATGGSVVDATLRNGALVAVGAR